MSTKERRLGEGVLETSFNQIKELLDSNASSGSIPIRNRSLCWIANSFIQSPNSSFPPSSLGSLASCAWL